MNLQSPDGVVVVIPTLNEERHIEATIEMLMQGDPHMAETPILVADGGSTDQTRAIVERLSLSHPKLYLIHNPGRLQSAGVNLAARLAWEHGGLKILVRCDAHAGYPPGFVRASTASLFAHGAESIVAPMDSQGAPGFSNAVAWVSDSPFGSGGSAHRGGKTSGYVDHGHHVAFQLERYIGLGGYDETFSHNEDAEFDRRLIESGGRIFLDASLRIGYFPRSTLQSLWRQYRNYGRGRARTILKHAMGPKLRQLIPVINSVGLVGCVAGALVWPILLIWPAIYFCALVACSIGFSALKKSWDGLHAGPALFAMHNAWALGFIETMLKRPQSPLEQPLNQKAA